MSAPIPVSFIFLRGVDRLEIMPQLTLSLPAEWIPRQGEYFHFDDLTPGIGLQGTVGNVAWMMRLGEDGSIIYSARVTVQVKE